MKISLGISNFLDEISSLSHCIVVLCFFAISKTSLRKSFLSFHAILWNSAFKWLYLSISLFTFSASKVMLKILQARLQQYVNCELPDVQGGFR